MYVIDNSLKSKIYSGGLSYTPLLYIGDTPINVHEIKSISYEDFIIDTSSNVMYIGSFISNKLEIEFHKTENFDFTEQLTFSIDVSDGTTTNRVPIGVFNIETSPTDYYNNLKLTALDNAVLLKQHIDIEPFMEIATGDTEKSITAENLLIEICNYFGVNLGTYPNVNRNLKTYSYDSNFSGKQYISYIAEVMGGVAKFDRTGTLNIKPLKSTSVGTINGLQSKSFVVKELYKISKVIFDNGFVIPSEFGTDTNNTIFIRADNIFINGEDTQRDTIVENIYNSVVGYEIQGLTTENYADITLDSTDIVTYTLNNIQYLANYNVSWKWQGSIMSKIDITLPTKSQEKTTNIFGDEDSKIRKLTTKINTQENSIELLFKETKDIDDIISVLQVDLSNGVIVLNVDENNYPLTNAIYSIGYETYFKGSKITLNPTTTDEHIGITTSVNNSSINFTVNTNTQIPLIENSYDFVFTYADTEQTYTTTKTIKVQLLHQEKEIITSTTEPLDTNKLWYDINEGKLKSYNVETQEWETINDYSSEIGDINRDLETINRYIKFINGSIILGDNNTTAISGDYKLKIENDRIGIYYKDTLISSWVQDNLDITTQTIGQAGYKFQWVTLDNGSLSFRKVSD